MLKIYISPVRFNRGNRICHLKTCDTVMALQKLRIFLLVIALPALTMLVICGLKRAEIIVAKKATSAVPACTHQNQPVTAPILSHNEPMSAAHMTCDSCKRK